MLNISRSKSNQTMKLGQLMEYIIRELLFFKNYVENEGGRLVPDLFIFQGSLIGGKSKWSAA